MGKLIQTLTWASDGSWTLHESVSYRAMQGDDDLRRNPGLPQAYASAYASFITHLNETEGIELFIDELSTELDPECGPTRTRIVVNIRDDRRNEEVSWIRCGDGSLRTLMTSGAGPDPHAGRVAQAAILAKDYVLGENFVSTYEGTVPFGTLAQGGSTTSDLSSTLVFLSEDGEEPPGWPELWRDLKGDDADPPFVDWSTDMVLVGAVGRKEEAGDTVEIRRVLRVDRGSVVEFFHRIPGDFCAPASLVHYPYHVVLAPRTPAPVIFSDVRIELVTCG